MTTDTSIPVAIIGVGALFPGSTDANGFWNDILAGTDLIGDVPEHRWLVNDYYDEDQKVPDKTYGRRGGFIDHTDFDPVAFGIPPNVIEATDTAQLLALIVAQQVLDDAFHGQFGEMDRSRMSVVLGVTAGQELMNEMANRLQRPVWVKALREVGLPEDEVQAACDKISEQYTPWQENTFPGLLGNVVAGRIANRFDFGGTNCVTDAACASALSALSLGLNELYLGHSDVVISGGVDTFNDIFMYMCFSKTPALSATGDCRPFSDAADGTILGEGMAMFAMKRLEDAERDGDQIYAVIRGCGSSSDGRAKSIYAPLSEGQAKALNRAYERAGYTPDTVELVEAHGTGTKAGDIAEFAGLRSVFESEDQRTALGSIKSQIGHTKAAAGAAGLLKTVLALHHRVLPPTLKVDRPNPKLDIEHSAFYVNTESRPWIRDDAHPRRASVSAFGFGGSNFHVAVEAYNGEHRASYFRPEKTELFLFSADSFEALSTSLKNGSDFFHARAQKLRTEFSASQKLRLAIIANDEDDLERKIQLALDGCAASTRWTHPSGIYFSTEQAGKTAFLFPGQGAQYLSMGAEWMQTFPWLTKVWDRFSASEFESQRLVDVLFPRPVFDDASRELQRELVTKTEWAQPLIGMTSLTMLQFVERLGLEADFFAGHSYGELTALHASGCIDQETLISLSRKRGELMRDASENDGAMTAVAADIDTVQTLLADHPSVVVANHNGPKQVVVSGETVAVSDFESSLKATSIGFKRLNVATAFHSSVVSDAAVPFEKAAESLSLNAENLDRVFSNTTAAPYDSNWSGLLGNQLAKPVRWVELIENLEQQGVTTFVEIGPSSILKKLTSKIAKDSVVVSTDQKGRSAWSNALHFVAALSATGHKLSLDLFEEIRTPIEREKPGLAIPLAGGNYKKPYPPKGGSAALPKPNPARPKPAPIKENVMTNQKTPPSSQPVQHQQPQTPQPQAVQYQQPAAPQPAPGNAWFAAFQESQRQMAQAHIAYQTAMAQSHTAFLNALATSQSSLAAMVTGGAMPVAPQMPVAPIAPMPMAQMPVAPMPVAQVPVAQVPVATMPVAPMPVAQVPVAQVPAPMPVAPMPVAKAPAPAPPTQTATTTIPVVSLEDVLLDTIAEKTGYPKEMLAPEMQLEADLGIDSIKRVEILSAVTETAGALDGVDPSEMNNIQTIEGVLDYLRKQTNGSSNGNGHNGNGHHKNGNGTPAVMAVSSEDQTVESELLVVVSDKTGYPVEMLDLQMKLEADLGIDSIKRVEILSEVTERNPAYGALDGTEMANLATLGEIVDYIETSVGKK